jgi:hypothetical protein
MSVLGAILLVFLAGLAIMAFGNAHISGTCVPVQEPSRL